MELRYIKFLLFLSICKTSEVEKVTNLPEIEDPSLKNDVNDFKLNLQASLSNVLTKIIVESKKEADDLIRDNLKPS